MGASWIKNKGVGRAMTPKPIPFDEAIKRTSGKRRSILLGNGFSVKYTNYKTLLEKAPLEAEDPIRALFRVLRTMDFELVVKALEEAALVENAYGMNERSTALAKDGMRLRKVLVDAVRATHPKHRDELAGVIPACLEFLSHFAEIFTVNYDLLLNWTIMGSGKFGDGFGLGQEINGFRRPWQDDLRCNVYNVHGGLHLFNGADGKVEKRVEGTGILDAIEQTITTGDRFPLYVAEGTSLAKQRKIESDRYLKHCYLRLRQATQAFFVYGHSAGASDGHIYDALFTANIDHLYFCVYEPSGDRAEIDSRLSAHQKRLASNVGYTLVDAESAGVWGRLPAN